MTNWKEVKKDWWDTVHKCLVKFHNKTAEEATALINEKAADYRKLKVGLIYLHEEPFREAEHIVGNQLNFSDEEYRQKYLIEIIGYTPEYFEAFK